MPNIREVTISCWLICFINFIFDFDTKSHSIFRKEVTFRHVWQQFRWNAKEEQYIRKFESTRTWWHSIQHWMSHLFKLQDLHSNRNSLTMYLNCFFHLIYYLSYIGVKLLKILYCSKFVRTTFLFLLTFFILATSVWLRIPIIPVYRFCIHSLEMIIFIDCKESISEDSDENYTYLFISWTI